MPLDKSGTTDALHKNVAELIGSFKRKGRIGKSRPASKAEARKQALAIAFGLRRSKS